MSWAISMQTTSAAHSKTSQDAIRRKAKVINTASRVYANYLSPGIHDGCAKAVSDGREGGFLQLQWPPVYIYSSNCKLSTANSLPTWFFLPCGVVTQCRDVTADSPERAAYVRIRDRRPSRRLHLDGNLRSFEEAPVAFNRMGFMGNSKTVFGRLARTRM